jgi:hypothetical protein
LLKGDTAAWKLAQQTDVVDRSIAALQHRGQGGCRIKITRHHIYFGGLPDFVFTTVSYEDIDLVAMRKQCVDQVTAYKTGATNYSNSHSQCAPFHPNRSVETGFVTGKSL